MEELVNQGIIFSAFIKMKKYEKRWCPHQSMAGWNAGLCF